MRIAALVLCGAAIGLAGMPASSSFAQSNGPAADKIDTGPADTGKVDGQQPSPPSPPDTAPPPAATPLEAAPQAQAPPAQEQPQQPVETAAPAGVVETVGSSQAISILGKKVVGPDGKIVLGSVIDMLVDSDGTPRAAVIDFGGFLGVGSRHVAIDWNALKFHLDDPVAPVQLDLDPEKIKAAPEYKELDANAEVVEPELISLSPLPPVAPLSELPIEPQLLPTVTPPAKNAGQ